MDTEYVLRPFVAAFGCPLCDGTLLILARNPDPDHNLDTLYECKPCVAVFSLSEFNGHRVPTTEVA